MTTTISKLRVGQRFSWIPAAWFGPCKLISKRKCFIYEWLPYKKIDIYDLEYDAAVMNPPGIDYGVPGSTRVRLLTKKPGKSTRQRFVV